MPDEFIPPPEGEPAPEPPPEGATDAGLGGVEVPLEDVPRALATAAGKPTWVQVLALATAQLAAVVKGREKENINPFTRWYYGNATAAAWCFIFISWVLNKLGGLDLIGGKHAWVPDIRKISGYRAGSSGMQVGAIVAIADFSHIGFCVYRSGSTFHLLSGNSTSTAGSDGVTVKSYDVSVVSGHVNLAYAAGDPNAYPGTVYRYVKGGSLMSGSHVKWIQTRLGVHGHKVTVDGQFGPKTDAAVRAFQKDAKLTVDGQVGPKTWAALAK